MVIETVDRRAVRQRDREAVSHCGSDKGQCDGGAFRQWGIVTVGQLDSETLGNWELDSETLGNWE